jgi:hypothetical protein
MKRNWLTKVSGLILVLTLVTMSLVSGTYAKYVSEFVATGEATVAKWLVELEGNSDPLITNTTFDLVGTLNDSGIDGNLLAPGAQGSFVIAFDGTATEVAHNIKIVLDVTDLEADLDYLSFYSDNSYLPAKKLTSVSGEITVFDENFPPSPAAAGTATVYWEWPFDNSDDAGDTADGVAAETFDVGVTMTATQLNTYTP